jgi:hypothetical protein
MIYENIGYADKFCERHFVLHLRHVCFVNMNICNYYIEQDIQFLHQMWLLLVLKYVIITLNKLYSSYIRCDFSLYSIYAFRLSITLKTKHLLLAFYKHCISYIVLTSDMTFPCIQYTPSGLVLLWRKTTFVFNFL